MMKLMKRQLSYIPQLKKLTITVAYFINQNLLNTKISQKHEDINKLYQKNANSSKAKNANQIKKQVVKIQLQAIRKYLKSCFLIESQTLIRFLYNMLSIAPLNSNELKETSIDIAFQNVTYKVNVQVNKQTIKLPCFTDYQQKIILDNVSGIIKAKQITAIIGASGAGKTTLLNVLACRVPTNQMEGKLFANSVNYDYQNFGDFANYVMQQDVLMQTLTVRETLQFAANLKLSDSEERKRQRIELLCKKLKLQTCLDVIVGGVIMKGISGGERKRTSIAFQLISDPQVIMLDEPTSGLDSLTSFIIIRYLKQLAHQHNKTVLMTIHQPNTEIFALFDKLILMVEGKLIYQGKSVEAMQYFGDNFNLKCPQFHNPADYFMTIMHQENQENRNRYRDYFNQYSIHFDESIRYEIEKRTKTQIQKRTVEVPTYIAYKTLIKRDFINILRNPLLIKARLFQTIFMAIFAGGLFFGVGSDILSRTGWYGIVGFSFFLGANSFMIACGPVAIVFPAERDVFLKQQGAKLYGVGAYFLSRNIIEIPYSFIFPILQSLIFYWMIKLNSTPQQFFTFYLILYLISFNGSSIGLLIGSISKDSKSVSNIIFILIFIFILFSGMLKNLENLPNWIGWLQYISPIKYTLAAFMQNAVLYEPNSRVAQLNFDMGIWASIGLLLVLGVAYRLVAYLFLSFFRGKLQ